VLLDNVHKLQPIVVTIMMVQCKAVLQALASKKGLCNISGDDFIVNSTGALFGTYDPGIKCLNRLSFDLQSMN
jgi:hypothetical protein